MLNRRRLLIAVLAAVLVLSACLLLASVSGLRSFIRDAIVLPLAGLFWLGGVFLRSADESYLWLASLVVFFVLLVNGLAQALRHSQAGWGADQPPDDPQEKLAAGRLRFWLARVHMLMSWGTAAEYAHADLRRLAKQIDEMDGDGNRLAEEVERLLKPNLDKPRPFLGRRRRLDPARQAAEIDQLCATLEKMAATAQESAGAGNGEPLNQPQESG